MLVYSKTTISFLKKVKKLARTIVNEEMNLTFHRSRIEYNGHLYPIGFVVFEHDSILGYFKPSKMQIGLNKSLMYSAKTIVLKNIIRHELAHFMTFLIHGSDVADHGKEYRTVCNGLGWDEGVYKAKANLQIENDSFEGDLTAEKIINRVKKLLSLAESGNAHEAELATIKANDLLIKYNLENIESADDDHESYVHEVLTMKKCLAKHKAIYDILETFFVQPVLNYSKGQCTLEVVGSRVNVELAEFVAGFLDEELERLWTTFYKEHKNGPLIPSKPSFMNGVAKGYCEKIKESQVENIDRRSLVVLQNELQEKLNMAYGRLSSSRRSKGKYCPRSEGLGRQAGKNLTINKGISRNSGPTLSITH